MSCSLLSPWRPAISSFTQIYNASQTPRREGAGGERRSPEVVFRYIDGWIDGRQVGDKPHGPLEEKRREEKSRDSGIRLI